MVRRWRAPKVRPGDLVAYFGKQDRWNEPDIIYQWGGGGASKSDSRILMNALEEAVVYGGRTLRQELEVRGYDVTTLRFSVKRKIETPAPPIRQGGSDG